MPVSVDQWQGNRLRRSEQRNETDKGEQPNKVPMIAMPTPNQSPPAHQADTCEARADDEVKLAESRLGGCHFRGSVSAHIVLNRF
jgi:hypothetical protein